MATAVTAVTLTLTPPKKNKMIKHLIQKSALWPRGSLVHWRCSFVLRPSCNHDNFKDLSLAITIGCLLQSFSCFMLYYLSCHVQKMLPWSLKLIYSHFIWNHISYFCLLLYSLCFIGFCMPPVTTERELVFCFWTLHLIMLHLASPSIISLQKTHLHVVSAIHIQELSKLQHNTSPSTWTQYDNITFWQVSFYMHIDW